MYIIDPDTPTVITDVPQGEDYKEKYKESVKCVSVSFIYILFNECWRLRYPREQWTKNNGWDMQCFNLGRRLKAWI